MGIADQVSQEGYGIVEAVFDEKDLFGILEAMQNTAIPRSRAGIRHVMREPVVCKIAWSDQMLALATSAVGKGISVPRNTFRQVS